MPVITRGGTDPFLASDERGLLARYERLRSASRRLNFRLVDMLPRGAVARCARELGLVKGHAVVFADVDVEGPVVLDYAVHDHRPTADKRSVAERFCSSAFDREAASLDEDAALARRHRASARFSLFEVREVAFGIGVHVYDLLRGGDPFLLADVALGTEGSPGVLLAARIVDAGEFRMTTGATLFTDDIAVDAALNGVTRYFGPCLDDIRRLPPVQQSRLARQVLRICLAQYALSHPDPLEE